MLERFFLQQKVFFSVRKALKNSEVKAGIGEVFS